MRTPKILRLHKLIDWYNEEENLKIEKKGENRLAIGSTAWLSGMSDADSNFNIILTEKKTSYRVQRQWRLEISQKTHHGSEQYRWAESVSAFLENKLYSRHRVMKMGEEEKIYSSWIMVAHSENSLKKIEEYFKKYPLYSSKYLDYKDWRECGLIETKNKESHDRVLEIKAGMNNKRTHYNWDHLK